MRDELLHSGQITLRYTSKAQRDFGTCVYELPSDYQRQSPSLFNWKSYLSSSVIKWLHISSWNKIEHNLDLDREEIFWASVKFLNKMNYWRNQNNISLSPEFVLHSPLHPGWRATAGGGLSRTTTDLLKCFALWTVQVHHFKLLVQMKSQ